MTYELTQKQHAQYYEEKKKMKIAFKSTNEEEESASDEENKHIALIARKFKRFMKKKWKSGKKYEAKGDSSK